jgi:ribosomal protein L11 methyltransferase
VTTFWQLSFELGRLDPQAAEEACFACAALSVTFIDAEDNPVLEPLPGEFRLWPTTRVRALFAGDGAIEPLVQGLSAALGRSIRDIHAEAIEDRIWEREWLRDFHAMRFGQRLWICPHHEPVDPGLAFGTGTHPTTALCLEWLDRYIGAGQRVIDYGCGSGILALAAVRLGASHAHCFDIDPQALIAASGNAEVNGIGGQITVCSTVDLLPRRADVLLANILSGPLCTLAPTLSALVRPNGTIVLAGLLEHEARDVTQAYSACFDISPFGIREGWVGLSGKRHDLHAMHTG